MRAWVRRGLAFGLFTLGAGVSTSWAQQAAQPPLPVASAAGPAPSPPEAAPAAAATPQQNRTPLVWRLDILAPKPIEALLRSYLDLARFESEIAKGQAPAAAAPAASAAGPAPPASQAASSSARPAAAPTPAISRGELRRLVSAAPDQVRQLLETMGYFDATVKVNVNDETPTVVRITITPGPRTRVADVHIEFEGDLETRAEAGDKVAVELREQLQKAWSLPAGKTFTQEGWNAAKNAALAQLRAQGYPTAVWSGTSAHVDAEQHLCHIFVVADSGPAFYFGPIAIEGLTRQDPQSARNVLTFRSGELYSEKKLLDSQEALQKAGLYDTAYITMSNDPARARAAPVTVRLHEAPMQQATFGVGISADTGPRVSLEHVHRRVANTDWQAKTLLQLGRDESVAQLDLTSHPLPDNHHNLLSGAITRLNADGTQTKSHRLRVGRTQDSEHIERTYYIEYQQATVSDANARTDASAVMFNYQWVLRALDSPVLPTRGYATQLETGVGQSFATTRAGGLFTRVYAKGLLYEPLPSQWYATGRLEGGQVFANDATGIPDPLLFRAGGDESVRGYGYRDLGPVRDGINVGGLVLGTASMELAHPLSSHHPDWWGAVFTDVGDAEQSVHGLIPHWGYGMGVRWRSPVGPLRVDLAYGQSVHRLRLHFSVGIAL